MRDSALNVEYCRNTAPFQPSTGLYLSSYWHAQAPLVRILEAAFIHISDFCDGYVTVNPRYDGYPSSHRT